MGLGLIGEGVTGDDVTGANVVGLKLTGAGVTGDGVTGAGVTGLALIGAGVTGDDVTGASVTGAVVVGRGVGAKLGSRVGNRVAPGDGAKVGPVRIDGVEVSARVQEEAVPVGYTATSAKSIEDVGLNLNEHT